MPPRRDNESDSERRAERSRQAARESMDTAPDKPLTETVPGGRYILEDRRTEVNANGEPFKSDAAEDFRDEEQARLEREAERQRQAEERAASGEGVQHTEPMSPAQPTTQPSTGPLT